MPYTVTIERQPAKFLRALNDKRLHSRLRNAIDSLAENPRAMGCEKMQGSPELYRVRVGDYRIIYEIRDAVLVVLVVKIGNRRDIYRD